MAHQVNTVSAVAQADNTVEHDIWLLAKKRANDYLKLHHLPQQQCERLLEQVSKKLLNSSAHNEQMLIQQFIELIREELAFAQAQQTKLAKQKADEALMAQGRMESRNQTGPRFERSSIREAPLQAITLRLLRSRQLHMQH